MKKLSKNISVACLIIGITFFTQVNTVNAETIYYTDYQYDTNHTSDGRLELLCEGDSLQEGEVVDVYVKYHNVKPYAIDDYLLTYDSEVFEPIEKTEVELDRDNFYLFSFCDMSEEDFDEFYTKEIEYYGLSGYLKTYDMMVYNVYSNRSTIIERTPTDSFFVHIRLRVKKTVEKTTVLLSPTDLVTYSEGSNYSECFSYWKEDGDCEMLAFTLNSNPSSKVKLSSSSEKANVGGEISIPINLATNDGFNGLGVSVTYDDSILTYEDYSVADSLKDKVSLKELYAKPGQGTLNAAFISKDNITTTGDFATLKFKIKDGVAVNTKTDIKIDITQVTNKEETSIKGTGATVSLTVKEQQPQQPQDRPVEEYSVGEVSGDGKINLTDAIYILLSYNGEMTLTEQQKTAADINKDGEVTLVDALQILKYFVGEISTL